MWLYFSSVVVDHCLYMSKIMTEEDDIAKLEELTKEMQELRDISNSKKPQKLWRKKKSHSKKKSHKTDKVAYLA